MLRCLLAIIFAGGRVFDQTPIEILLIPTIDALGIYPMLETFGAHSRLMLEFL